MALGDINKDGLVDIFLAGNQTSNRLYLNQGNLQFKDITDQAGLNSSGFWSTGISMADINGDGLLDIYVCKSGPQGGKKSGITSFISITETSHLRRNPRISDLQKNASVSMPYFLILTKTEIWICISSATQADLSGFLTFARDNGRFGIDGGNKLFRNDGEKFTDVSEEAGIYGSSIGYGLGVTVADLNDDNWPDLYVSNDFFERDYLYLNNQDGTFSEVLTELLPEISMGSMGADIADLNNDGRPDIFVTEMLPNELARVKTKTPFEEWDKYQSSVKAGYHHQFTRNTLQRNLGFRPGTKTPVFSEVSRMAGVEATDWSWGALIFDMDNDGRKDIFVANGIVKDLTDFDFVDFYVNNQEKVKGFREDSVLLTKMIDAFPSNPQANFLFKNLGNWNFENLSQSTGLDQLTFSTGSAYGDLDNDGDLDLVINNLNGPVFLYQNTTSETKRGNYLSIELGSAFGSKVMAFSEDQTFFQEYQPVKGYMSSVDPRIHFGLGKAEKLDSIQILWPDGKIRTLKEVRANQALTLSPEPDDKIQQSISQVENQLLLLKETQIPFRHQESDFVDFDRDRLRFWMISNEGPKAAKADVNGDGLEDLFIPGAKGQTSALLLQSASGEFRNIQPELFEIDAIAEDVTAHFFSMQTATAKRILSWEAVESSLEIIPVTILTGFTSMTAMGLSKNRLRSSLPLRLRLFYQAI